MLWQLFAYSGDNGSREALRPPCLDLKGESVLKTFAKERGVPGSPPLFGKSVAEGIACSPRCVFF